MLLIFPSQLYVYVFNIEVMNTRRYHFDKIDSTNNWVKKHVGELDKEALTLVTADEQTAGRGSRQRRWVSPSKQNVYATFAFFLKEWQADISNISLVTAICAIDVLGQLGFDAQWKWPNDLFLGKKKVGGILCEITHCEDMLCVIAGIGINVNMPQSLLDAIDQPATSLQIERGQEYLPEIVIELLDKTFKDALEAFLKHGFEPFLQRYQSLLMYRRSEQL